MRSTYIKSLDKHSSIYPIFALINPIQSYKFAERIFGWKIYRWLEKINDWLFPPISKYIQILSLLSGLTQSEGWRGAVLKVTRCPLTMRSCLTSSPLYSTRITWWDFIITSPLSKQHIWLRLYFTSTRSLAAGLAVKFNDSFNTVKFGCPPIVSGKIP